MSYMPNCPCDNQTGEVIGAWKCKTWMYIKILYTCKTCQGKHIEVFARNFPTSDEKVTEATDD